MRKSKLNIILTSLVLISVVGGSLALEPVRAEMTPEAKFALKRDILAAFVDLTIKYYEKIEGVVEKSTKLKDQEKKDLLAVVEPGVITFGSAKDKVAASTTEEELAATTKEAQEAWVEVQTKLKQVEGGILYQRIDAVVGKSLILAGSAKAVSTTLQGLGVYTGTLDSFIENFEDEINSAAGEARAGVDIYKSIIRLGDLVQAPAALEHFSKAWQALEAAEKLGQEIMAEMEKLVAEQK